MAKRKKHESRAIWLTLLGFAGLGVLTAVLARGSDFVLFNSKGRIASEERSLMITSTLIMVAFAAAVLFFLYYFAWKYRETNEKAHYDPQAGRSRLLGAAAWISPGIVFVILVSLMIPATFRLEPNDKIESSKKPLTIQVVALRWKWLFIYPEQRIATVNHIQIPEDTPIEFQLTADETPMSSFWIPHLGGQLYAMTEHLNRLNLIADERGNYEGYAAEINGEGFAAMRFDTHVSSQQEFDEWIGLTQKSNDELSAVRYAELLKPSEDHPEQSYKNPDPDLYSNILKKYGGSSHSHGSNEEGYE